MSSSLHILIVEDQALDAELCEHELRRAGLDFITERVYTRATYERALAEFAPDVILSDFSMPTDLDGFSALGIARERAIDVPFVFVSGTIGEERAVAAMKAGATDYVLKDKLDRLGPVVKRALQEARDRRSMREAQQALRASEATFRSFMEHLPGRASIRDREGHYTYVNGPWQECFALESVDVIGQHYDVVLGPQIGADVRRIHGHVIECNEPVKRMVKQGAGSRTKWWLSHHFPIPASDGTADLVGTISIDVTEQKLQEEKLARLARIRAMLLGINGAIMRTRQRPQLMRDTCRIAVEQGGLAAAWMGLYDSESGELRPVASAGFDGEDEEPHAQLIAGHPESGSMVERVIATREPAVYNDLEEAAAGPGDVRAEALKRGGFRSMGVLPLVSTGEVVGTLTLLARETDMFAADELKLLMQFAHDVSFALEYIEKEEKLAYLAWHDPVTGLANRALLHERLSQALESEDRRGGVAVLVWDMKRFRTINASFGRRVGDELLRELGTRIATLWPEVSIIARLSADSFGGFVVDGRDAANIAALLERSAAALAEPYVVGEREIAVGITVGIALYPGDGHDADTLLANAEAALKQAKARGERYLFYETAMNARVAEKLSLETRLRRALEKDQFVLHYQPKVELGSSSVSGLEALIRWNDPEDGLVAPMQFIPLLEEMGLILEVGRWALWKAHEDWRSRASRGLYVPRVAVNVSPMQLRRPDFVDIVAQALNHANRGEHGLDLEITESLLMEDIAANAGKLHALKEMGVKMAIDDFGTGYSSLSYLAKLPVDAVKIDRAFIQTMVSEPQSMAIVSTIISMAHTLRMLVIAEGVESSEQSKQLRAVRCDQGQGFFYAYPTPWERFFGQ
jgi:diguanylate cyclase (GGDEF)-like protein/PAS domain S-box-containing protein